MSTQLENQEVKHFSQFNWDESPISPNEEASIVRAWEFRQTSEMLIEEAISRNVPVTLSAHKGPDDDAAYSIKAYLEILKIRFPQGRFQVVFSNRKVDRYNELFDPSEIIWAEEQEIATLPAMETTHTNPDRQEVKPHKRKADIVDYLFSNGLLIFMDAARYNRISNQASALEQMVQGHPDFPDHRLTVAIPDHHTETPDANATSLIEQDKTSTCELIYLMYRNMDLPPQIYEHLLRGLFSDTRFMRFIHSGNTQALDYVKELMRRSGIPDLNQPYIEMNKKSKGTIELEKLLAKKGVENGDIHRVIDMAVPKDFPNFWYSYTSDTDKAALRAKGIPVTAGDGTDANRNKMQEALVNGANLSWTITGPGKDEQGNVAYFIGFRGNNTDSLVPMSAALFNGGGHGLATGGKFVATEEEAALIMAEREKYTAKKRKFDEVQYVSKLILRRMIRHTKWSQKDDNSWTYQLLDATVPERKPFAPATHDTGIVFKAKAEAALQQITETEANRHMLEQARAVLDSDPFSAWMLADRARIVG